MDRPPNLLVVLLDDVGTDQLAAWGTWPGQARTPTLDRLASEGVRFQHAYANAECSPTRAAVLTGRYGRRTGVGSVIDPDDRFWLEGAERGLPELLQGAGYTAGLAGKWHLGASEELADHPSRFGFSRFAGSPENLGTGHGLIDDPGWTRWVKNTDGSLAVERTYATTDTVDDALELVTTLPEPWLAWVAFNAAHGPYEAPPASLLAEPLPPTATAPVVYRAMLEALDAELGRLLGGLPNARTTVIVLGDNGSPAGLSPAGIPAARAKNTVYEGGVRVPLLVGGWGVEAPGTTSDALVHAVDVFATVAELAGVDIPDDIDGVSFRRSLVDPEAPGARSVVWSEKFEPNGHDPELHVARSIRDGRYAYVRTNHPGIEVEELFELDPARPDGGPDLLAGGLTPTQSAARDSLSAALDAELARLRE